MTAEKKSQKRSRHDNNNRDEQDLLQSMDISTSTMDLHRSSLFRMQVTELLEECQLDLTTRKWTADAQDYLQRISKSIENVTITEDHQKTSLKVQPIGCTKTPIAWTKKSGNAQMLPTFSVMAVIPAEWMGAKDHLNHRYFHVSHKIMRMGVFFVLA